jgi:hypothetical protein
MYANGNPLTCTANAFGASKLSNGATYAINVGKCVQYVSGCFSAQQALVIGLYVTLNNGESIGSIHM